SKAACTSLKADWTRHPWFALSASAFPASGGAPSKRGVGSTTSSGGMGSAAVAPRSLNRRMPGRSLVSKDPTALLKALTAAVKADRKSTRLNSSHDQISYAVFCLKKKKTHKDRAFSAVNLLHYPQPVLH